MREDAFIKEGWMHVATEYHGDVRDRLHLCATVHGCDAKKIVWGKVYFHTRGEMSRDSDPCRIAFRAGMARERRHNHSLVRGAPDPIPTVAYAHAGRGWVERSPPSLSKLSTCFDLKWAFVPHKQVTHVGDQHVS